jgi:Rrf2 family protein
VHDVDDPTGLAPVVKKAGCRGATPLFQRLPPPAQGRWAAEAHRIADAPECELEEMQITYLTYYIILVDLCETGAGMITNKAKYALKAMVYLAKRSPDKPALISEIAETETIPRKFLEQILVELKGAGLLQSRMGKGGGYMLARTPDRITFGEILRLTDGPLAPVSCVSKAAYKPCQECRDETLCVIRVVMRDVRDAIADILDNTTLKDGIQKIETLISTQGFAYEI